MISFRAVREFAVGGNATKVVRFCGKTAIQGTRSMFLRI